MGILCSEGPMFRGSYIPSFFGKARNIGPSEYRPFYPLVRSYVPRVLSSEPKAEGRDGPAFVYLIYWDYLFSSILKVPMMVSFARPFYLVPPHHSSPLTSSSILIKKIANVVFNLSSY